MKYKRKKSDWLATWPNLCVRFDQPHLSDLTLGMRKKRTSGHDGKVRIRPQVTKWANQGKGNRWENADYPKQNPWYLKLKAGVFPI